MKSRMNGRPNRRHVLELIGALPLLACHSAEATDPINAATLRQRSDVGDTPALVRALALGRPVYLPAGKGSGTKGTYVVDMLDLPEGATLYGDGPGTILRSSSATVPSILHVDGSRTQTRNVTLRQMTLIGYAASNGFREHHNLVNLSGIADCLIEDMIFEGFAGDGIYLGAERAGPTRVSRQNERVTIRNCDFDGVNNANRNGISVTGGTDILIDSCRFNHCTRRDMPGPIDFEADDFAFYVFDRISVTNCTFKNCGGNVGQVAIVIPAKVKQVPRNIKISGNRFESYVGTGSDIALTVHRPATFDMPDMNVLIENNVGMDGRAGVRLYSGRGITVRNNRWTRYQGQALIGYAEPNDGCRDVSVSDWFEQCGSIDGVALGIYSAANILVAGNHFVDCGNRQPGSACILFGKGQSKAIVIRDNEFGAAGGGIPPIRRSAAHRLDDPVSISPASIAILGPSGGR
ncbi:right-handed parallel beta-helix repeat-containing protein [uncultured Sphingomonas sp.]|uniref:right-handed parallel beta-helix repeat-containing protein n=1 Tax=uncultured Sphingomonas sp. TaxID=158754 RepID=UPI0025E905BA|nr:right-handed parallel beta-helix repeat-containing protein [uncultured Sphingomonas sp.]